jgi:hypothetical protein
VRNVVVALVCETVTTNWYNYWGQSTFLTSVQFGYLTQGDERDSLEKNKGGIVASREDEYKDLTSIKYSPTIGL